MPPPASSTITMWEEFWTRARKRAAESRRAFSARFSSSSLVMSREVRRSRRGRPSTAGTPVQEQASQQASPLGRSTSTTWGRVACSSAQRARRTPPPAARAVGPQPLAARGAGGLLVGPAVELALAAGDVAGPQPGQAAGADHVGRPVAGDLLEPGVPGGHGAVRVEGGDPVRGVLHDLGQLGPLLEDGLGQVALL